MSLPGPLLLLSGEQVRDLLAGQEIEILAAVRAAYETHAREQTSLPHSVFLHPPDRVDRRIIALPAWLGGSAPAAGIKWIASFPSNHDRGLDRASAVMVLNDPDTGTPRTVLEASLVSAARTAASAALGARHLAAGESRVVGLVGCGPINFEILRFLRIVSPAIDEAVVFDLAPARAERFTDKCRTTFPGLSVERADDLAGLCRRTRLLSFATTAAAPHVEPRTPFQPGTTLLHVSLRDLAPETILVADNVVDDVDHVCRSRTSIHLTEEVAGHRRFMRTTIGDILLGRAPGRPDPAGLTVFSPFGLGILDLAVAQLVAERAADRGIGVQVPSFLPRPWADS